MKTKEYYTFSTQGLSELQITFLAELEEKFIEGEEVVRQDLYDWAHKYRGDSKKVAEIIEAFNYWEFLPKPFIQQTAKTPINLSELVTETPKGKYIFNKDILDSFHVTTTEKFNLLRLGMLEGLSTYFEITNDVLYIKYDQIIGSRCVAYINNDLTPPKDGRK